MIEIVTSTASPNNGRRPSSCEEEPDFSVIVPVYNRSEKVLRAVHSVLTQDHTNFEVIVVNDGSTDETGTVLASIDDPRLRVIHHDVNRGGAAARNSGIQIARGRFTAFLDSDDEWLSAKLTNNLALAERLEDRWVAFNQVRVVTENNVRTSFVVNEIVENISEFLFVKRGLVQTSAVFLPTALAKQVLFEEALPRLQDWDFYLRLAEIGAVFHAQKEVLTVHYALDTPDRISALCDPDWLVDWIGRRRSGLSSAAEVGFFANKVAPEATMAGRRLEALWWLASGLVRGVVRIDYAVIEIVRIIVPRSLFEWIRKTKGKILERQR